MNQVQFIPLETEIVTGNTVQYIDTKYNKETRRNMKVPIFGIWDGEKVECTDNEKTTVRNKAWLTPGVLVNVDVNLNITKL